jgi:very-short-patch-repair endonuclease
LPTRAAPLIRFPLTVTYPASLDAASLEAELQDPQDEYIDAWISDYSAKGALRGALKALADKALARWPYWFGLRRLDNPLESLFAFDQKTSDMFRVIQRAARIREADPAWLQKAVTEAIARGEAPFFRESPVELQARQLALALDPRAFTLRLILPPKAGAHGERLIGYAKAALWLAQETGLDTRAVIPEHLLDHPDLSVIQLPAPRPGPQPTAPPQERDPADEAARGAIAELGANLAAELSQELRSLPKSPGAPPTDADGADCHPWLNEPQAPPARPRGRREDPADAPGRRATPLEPLEPYRDAPEGAPPRELSAAAAARESAGGEGALDPLGDGLDLSFLEKKRLLVRPFGDILGKPNPDSPGELLLASRLELDAELKNLFLYNQLIQTNRGPQYVVDLLWPEGRLVVEVDGYSYHGGQAAFEYDRHRDFLLLLSGYRAMRLSHAEIKRDSDRALQKIRDAVAFVRACP